MRGGHLQPSRPFYFDRAPIGRAFAYGSIDAPAAATERFTYTTPSDKLAFIETIALEMLRITAAAPVGQSTIRVAIDTLTDAEVNLVVLDMLNNAVDANRQAEMGGAFVLEAAEIVRALTADTSTGGTILYRAALKLTEFGV
jgi:hypothetical protein